MPTHPIEGEDYGAGSGALAGERIHKDAAPATAFRQYQANALWHGLRTLVKQVQVSGDLTAASGSADQSEGYVRLAKAIRRASNGFQQDEVDLVTIANAVTNSFLIPPDKFVFLMEEGGGGPYPNAAAVPDGAVAHQYRVILVINNTTSTKLVGSTGTVTSLRAGESCFFYGAPASGATAWTPIGRNSQTGQLNVEIRGSVSGVLRTVVMRWAVRDGRAYIDIDPSLSASLSGTETIIISAVSNGTLPPILDATTPASAAWALLIPIIHAGTYAIGFITFQGAAGSRKMTVLNASGVSSFATSFQLMGANFSYPLA